MKNHDQNNPEEEVVEETRAASHPSDAEEVALSSEELDELKKKADERDLYLKELLRSKADFENYQKRIRKERPAWEEQALRRFLRELLPVFDNFERALAHASSDSSSADGLHEGVRLTYQMMGQVLKNHGVEEIRAEGETFNPELHEAMTEVEVEDLATGEVAAVLEKGYLHGDTVLRPTKVSVARNVGAAQNPAEGRPENEPGD